MPPSATETIAVPPMVTSAPRTAAAWPVRARRRPGWHRLVTVLTDKRAARAHLHELDLGGNHRTWT